MSTTAKERELPDVRAGQVWVDNDPRAYGRQIHVEVVVHDVGEPYAVCTTGARKTRIRLRRFRPTSTGYRLVRDAPKETRA